MAPRISIGNPCKGKRSMSRKGKEIATDDDIVDIHSSPDSTASPPRTAATTLSAPSLPAHWFRSYEIHGKWLDFFSSQKLCLCDSIDPAFLESLNLPCVSNLKTSGFWPLLNLGEVHFPRLTRLFFINLHYSRDRGHQILQTSVCNKLIQLKPDTIADIFGLPKAVSTDGHPSKAECISLAKASLFLPGVVVPKHRQPTHSVLKLEAKVIFTVLARCIFPRSNSRELITDQLLYLVYLVLSGYVLDVPNLILDHMKHSISSSRDVPLPYGNLLPHIFAHFRLNPSPEEKASHTGKVDVDCFKRIGILKVNDEWKLKSDMSRAELVSAGVGRSVSTAYHSSSIEDRFEELEYGFDALRRDVIDFQDEISDKMDATHELVAMINAKINNMFYLNALTFTCAGNILPLAEDAANLCRSKTSNVIFQCEQSVRGKKVLRPAVPEPAIITVEAYDVIKQYQKSAPQERIVDEMKMAQKMNQAQKRYKNKAEADVAAKKRKRDGGDDGYGEWRDE